MTVTIGRSKAVLSTLRNLESATSRLSQTFERLSSGKRINRASDDSAGNAVAATLRANSHVYNRASLNLSDGISALSIADQALGQLNLITDRQRELAEQSANGILGTEQRNALNKEAQSLRDEFNRIVETTRFNGRSLLASSSEPFKLQAGIGSQATLDVSILTQIAQGGGTQNYTMQGLGGMKQAPQSQTYFLTNGSTLIALGLGAVGGDMAITIETYQVTSSGGLDAVDQNIQVFAGIPEVGTSIMFFMGEIENGNNIRLSIGFMDAGATFFTQFLNISLNPDGTVGNFGAGPGAGSNQLASSINADLNGSGENEIIVNAGMGNLDWAAQIHYAGGTSGDSLAQAAFSIATQTSALNSLETLKELSEKIGSVRGRVGANLSRISASASVIQSSVEQFRAAESRIMDADIATESAQMVRLSILRESAVAVLAQANTLPALALTLLDISS